MNTARRRGRPRKPFDLGRALELRDAGMSLRDIATEMSTQDETVSVMKVQRELEGQTPPLFRNAPAVKIE